MHGGTALTAMLSSIQVRPYQLAVSAETFPRTDCQFCPLHRVDIQSPSGNSTIEVGEGETILQAALDHGIELSHDCKMGVCMTCPAKLVRASTAAQVKQMHMPSLLLIADRGWAGLCCRCKGR